MGLACLALTVPSIAHAGNDEGVPVGNPSAMTGAVVASIDDGSALWFNSAGIARVRTDTADVTASVFALRILHVPDLVEVVGGESYSENLIEFLTIPSALSYVRPITSNLNVGLGIFSPTAADLALRSDLDGGLMGVTGELAFALADTRSRYVGVLGLGWAPTSRLNLGASLRVGYASSFSTTQWALRRTDATSDAILVFGNMTSTKIVDAGLSIGAQWDATDELSFGLSFDGPTLAFFGYARTTTVAAAAARTATDLVLDAELDDAGNLEAAADPYEPARFRGGVSLTLSSWRIAADVDVALPLSTPDLGVERALLVNARLGGGVMLAEALELGFSLFTDLSPSRDANQRTDFVGGTIALHTEHRLALAAEEHSDEVVFSTYIALRYAYGFGEVTGLRFDPTAAETIIASSTALNAHEMMLHLGSSVSF